MGSLAAATLWIDGSQAPRERGAHRVVDDDDQTAMVKLVSGLDPIPKVKVDGQLVELAPPLAWYEVAWSLWPLALVAIGGALGGALGAVAAMVNLRLMRTDLPVAARYAVTLGVGLAAVLTYLLAATVLFAALGKQG